MGVFLVENMLRVICMQLKHARSDTHSHTKTRIIIYEINQKRSDIVFLIVKISMRSSMISEKEKNSS